MSSVNTVLDHIFADAVGSLRQALEDVHLERTVVDERFQSDLLLGDLTWSTSYALPGEAVPASVRSDITLQWPSASQTSYRQWVSGNELAAPPTIAVEVVLRVQELRMPPSMSDLLAPLPDLGPTLGGSQLERDNPTVETIYRDDPDDNPDYAFEVAYNGTCTLDGSAMLMLNTYSMHPGSSWVAAIMAAAAGRSPSASAGSIVSEPATISIRRI